MRLKKESVWKYPRPPIWQYHKGEIEIIHNKKILAKTIHAIRIIETSHPPTYYLPIKSIDIKKLVINNNNTYCEWKGIANYYDYIDNKQNIKNIGWFYPDPTNKFSLIKNYVSFYASKLDKCFVNKKNVIKQQGNYYGGWITDNLIGPFKGGMGTDSW